MKIPSYNLLHWRTFPQNQHFSQIFLSWSLHNGYCHRKLKQLSSSNLRQDCLHLTKSINALEKGMTPSLLLWVNCKLDWAFSLGMASSLRKGKLSCPCGVMVKAMDCGIKVSEFKFQLCHYVHFWTNTLGKGMNPPYPNSYGLNSTTAVHLEGWLGHQITLEGRYAIKQM